MRIEESAQQCDISLSHIQTLDSSCPTYIVGLCQSAGAMALVRGRDFRQSLFLGGTQQWGNGTRHLGPGGLSRPHIRSPRLKRQLKAGLAYIMSSLRALRGKIHWRCGRPCDRVGAVQLLPSSYRTPHLTSIPGTTPQRCTTSGAPTLPISTSHAAQHCSGTAGGIVIASDLLLLHVRVPYFKSTYFLPATHFCIIFLLHLTPSPSATMLGRISVSGG